MVAIRHTEWTETRMNAEQTIIAEAQKIISEALIKHAEAIVYEAECEELIKIAEDTVLAYAEATADVIAEAEIELSMSGRSHLLKTAADKDKTKTKTEFDETSPAVSNPQISVPVDNAQGELSPVDTIAADQQLGTAQNLASTQPMAVSDASMPPQVAGPGAAAGSSSEVPSTPVSSGPNGPQDPYAGDPMQDAPGLPPEPAMPDMEMTAANVARNFIGQDVWAAASNGLPGATDLIAATAAKLGIGVAEAMSRAITSTQNVMPQDPTIPTTSVDPTAMQAMGEQPPVMDANAQNLDANGLPVDPAMAQAQEQGMATQQAADQVIPKTQSDMAPPEDDVGQVSDTGKPNGEGKSTDSLKKSEEEKKNAQ